MGVDAHVVSRITDTEAVPQQIANVLKRLNGIDVEAEWFKVMENKFTGIDAQFLGNETHQCVAYIWERWYSPGYERGRWPVLAAVIEAMRAEFGNVYYLEDYYELPEVDQQWTIEDSAEMWSYWRSDQWDAYFVEMRKANEAASAVYRKPEVAP